LRHASGGHPPALLLTPTVGGPVTTEQLRSPGLIVGAMENIVYSSKSCTVPPGASLLVLCDGCYEIRDPIGQVMEFDEFEKFMQAHGTLPNGLDQLLSWIRERHGDGPLDDDFSIVRIQF
jgi:sigma-B regulation protein RsbU (phosphoserine phosphatase)